MNPIFVFKSALLIIVLALVIDISKADPTLLDIFNSISTTYRVWLGHMDWPTMTPENLASACGGAEDDKEGKQFSTQQVLACRFVKHYLNGQVTEIAFNEEDVEEAKDNTIKVALDLYNIFEYMIQHKEKTILDVLKSNGILKSTIKDKKLFYRYVSDCHYVLLYPRNKRVAWIMTCDIIKTYGPKLGAPEEERTKFNWP